MDGLVHDNRRLEGCRRRIRRQHHRPADGYVVDITVRQTDDDQYPCGWDYALHLGDIGGDTVLRYDNAHERTKGHERHTRDGVETIEFFGTVALYDRFTREAEAMSPVPWDWPE